MRVELGCPGHFIGVSACRFRRHTQTEHYRISTIGDYFPLNEGRTTVGAGPKDFFETMVFRIGENPAKNNDACPCREVESYSEIDQRRYATAGEAQAGHEELVRKYEELEARP